MGILFEFVADLLDDGRGCAIDETLVLKLLGMAFDGFLEGGDLGGEAVELGAGVDHAVEGEAEREGADQGGGRERQGGESRGGFDGIDPQEALERGEGGAQAVEQGGVGGGEQEFGEFGLFGDTGLFGADLQDGLGYVTKKFILLGGVGIGGEV